MLAAQDQLEPAARAGCLLLSLAPLCSRPTCQAHHKPAPSRPPHPTRQAALQGPAGGGTSPAALALLGDVAAGLAALHERAIVHRDLKPHNVLITDSCRAKLSDMGLSKQLVAEQSSFESHGAGEAGRTLQHLAAPAHCLPAYPTACRAAAASCLPLQTLAMLQPNKQPGTAPHPSTIIPTTAPCPPPQAAAPDGRRPSS